MKIPLLNGGFALIDSADYPLVSKYKWRSHLDRGRPYARAPGHLLMHRVILSAKRGEVVDHINHDSLDNRRSNIKIATHSASNHNRVLRNKLGFRGVRHVDGGYAAEISNYKKREHLGFYLNIKDAARAYDAAAIRIYGEHAVTNFGVQNG